MTRPPSTPAGSPARPEGEPRPVNVQPRAEKPLVSPVQRRGRGGEPRTPTVLTPTPSAKAESPDADESTRERQVTAAFATGTRDEERVVVKKEHPMRDWTSWDGDQEGSYTWREKDGSRHGRISWPDGGTGSAVVTETVSDGGGEDKEVVLSDKARQALGIPNYVRLNHTAEGDGHDKPATGTLAADATPRRKLVSEPVATQGTASTTDTNTAPTSPTTEGKKTNALDQLKDLPQDTKRLLLGAINERRLSDGAVKRALGGTSLFDIAAQHIVDTHPKEPLPALRAHYLLNKPRQITDDPDLQTRLKLSPQQIEKLTDLLEGGHDQTLSYAKAGQVLGISGSRVRQLLLPTTIGMRLRLEHPNTPSST